MRCFVPESRLVNIPVTIYIYHFSGSILQQLQIEYPTTGVLQVCVGLYFFTEENIIVTYSELRG